MKKNIFGFLKEKPLLKKIKEVLKSFSLSERIIFWIFLAIFIVSSIGFLINLNQKYLVEIPQRGGVLKEGVIGTPRFINPLIAVSDVDRDLSSIIYSGLMKKTSNGEIIPDLAESYEISEDNLTYTFYLKKNAKFHDKEYVLADDIIFTIIKAQDPNVRSPQRLNWEGVKVEKVNDLQIKFTLTEENPRFLENSTIGILPKHLWENISTDEFSLSKFNIEPIGTGPYKIKKIKRDNVDIPIYYFLESFNDYTLNKPFIKNIYFKFAKNQDDLISMYETGEVDAINGIDPQKINSIKKDTNRIIQIPLPRIFGIFFNQAENPVLGNKEVRKALEEATPRNKIIKNILFGFANPITSPIPGHLENFDKLEETEISLEGPNKILSAQAILEEAGWKKNEDGIYIKETEDSSEVLSISITTSNVPELMAVTEEVVSAWRDLGVQVELQFFDITELNQNIIRPRNFESLLFGMVISNYSDLHSFWHSSQRNDPGLNITGYANISTDNTLEDLRTENNPEKQEKFVQEFKAEIKNDIPAIFLYSPQFIYIIPDKVRGLNINNVVTANDRFINVTEWFIDTDKVWKIFKK